ncbi:lycopene beta-cyclase CrtY [Sphingosinicella sp.]|uniref:lycopene beta-cyclase CrtY n=1 Tax=Sphingosinicella sp. TaxID=1917971 RepID=UPI00403785A9
MARGRRQGVLIAGGGVAGCLAALALARHRPDVPLLIVEERESFGGAGFHHVFEDELDDGARALVDDLAIARWPGFYVAFDGFSRKLKAPCGGLDGPALHRAMIGTLAPNQYRLGARIVAVREDALVLDGGEEIKAEGAIDARGAANLSQLDLGYEARLERRYRFAAPHGVDRPVLIDATASGGAGASFMQVAPLDAERLVVADVSLADRSLPGEQAAARLDHYVALRGWRDGEIEDGAVVTKPLPRGGDFAAFWRIGGARVAKLGLRGGFVHPVTGRTIADAASAAMLLTRQQDFSGAALHDQFEAEARRLWRGREFLRGIGRSLAESEDRTAKLAALFALDPGLITRFHADKLGMFERMKVQRAVAGG